MDGAALLDGLLASCLKRSVLTAGPRGPGDFSVLGPKTVAQRPLGGLRKCLRAPLSRPRGPGETLETSWSLLEALESLWSATGVWLPK